MTVFPLCLLANYSIHSLLPINLMDLFPISDSISMKIIFLPSIAQVN